jgi:hypothetical protein
MVIGQIPDNNGSRSAQVESAPLVAPPTLKEIPYDFVARFELEGKEGNRVQDVINVSTDGAFVAVAIGYSFIPARFQPTKAVTGGGAVAKSVTTNMLADLTASFYTDPGLLAQALARFVGVDFFYSIVDSATGRELQNHPIHNIAGLGEANGHRPFRPMAQPMLFMPRSTIRIEVEEISQGSKIYGYDDQNGRRERSRLFIVLHGYKILGYGGAL